MIPLIADENISYTTCEDLVAAGYEVTSIREMIPGVSDDVIRALALARKAAIITQDHHFPEMAFRDGLVIPGLVYVRLPGYRSDEITDRLLEVLAEHSEEIAGNILVVEPQKIRVGPLRQPNT